MGFLSSICCCFYLPSRVSSDGGGALNQPLKSNFIKTEVQTTILHRLLRVTSYDNGWRHGKWQQS
ncbi:hypothetical protein RGQ29_025292 [Quercus rubra]|uniref:Uncharacterized protein n=1 Tax=Quercus rubra TaxID=3512 RepID=A0AAN7EY14_QUERU|nr:hypothetical protein RGQ29_025292 [Quercus rubra]